MEPPAYDLASTHLNEHRARHRRPTPLRGDGLSRDGGQPFGVDAAPLPLDEDVIAISEDVEHLEVDVGEGRDEALVVSQAHTLIQENGNAGMLWSVVLR